MPGRNVYGPHQDRDGCGAIAQVQHLPHITELRDRYDLVGLCDVSEKLVDFIGEMYHVPHRVTDTRTSSGWISTPCCFVLPIPRPKWPSRP